MSLRDYAFAHAGVKYQKYGQGILRGGGLSVQGEEIAVRPGLLKYGQAVCIMMEEARIPFGAALRTEYKSFADIETEYDTMDVTHADCGGLMRPGLAKGLPVWYNKMYQDKGEECVPGAEDSTKPKTGDDADEESFKYTSI